MPEPKRVHRRHLSSASHRTSHDHQVLFCFTFHFWFTLISRNDSSLFPEVCTYKLSKCIQFSFIDKRVLHKSCSSFCISSQHASGRMLSLLCCHCCCIGACGDKLWMQRKSCKICCIFHYLHVKGHKSSSVKSAIKK